MLATTTTIQKIFSHNSISNQINLLLSRKSVTRTLFLVPGYEPPYHFGVRPDRPTRASSDRSVTNKGEERWRSQWGTDGKYDPNRHPGRNRTPYTLLHCYTVKPPPGDYPYHTNTRGGPLQTGPSTGTPTLYLSNRSIDGDTYSVPRWT